MIFTHTPLIGAFVIEAEKRLDERGFFARIFCMDEFAAFGLESKIAQSSISYNKYKNTLRGLHYQRPPCEEIKIVRCVKGAIFDVAVDIRTGSPTFLKWFGLELSDENARAFYIPKGFAHGFVTLCCDTTVLYQMSEPYNQEYSAGIAWDDPDIGINWPDMGCERIISEKDLSNPRILNTKALDK